jgi:tetratricopeptide (TPR) repeat protein
LPTDEGTSSPWAVEPALLAALRLKKAVALYQEGSLDIALVEVEELLEVQPDHVEALDLVGEICWEQGDMATADAAWSRRAELEAEDPVGWSKVAAGRFELLRFDEALVSAREALRLDAGVARAWYVQGLILERRGDPEGERCLRRAHTLDPAKFPQVTRAPAQATWERAWKQAWKLLPDELRTFLKGVPVRWFDFPEEGLLRVVDPPLSPHTDILFTGEPPDLVEGGDPWLHKPESVSLFKVNLARPFADPAALADRIADAIEGEAEGWLGTGEEELGGAEVGEPSSSEP